jgi:creatinine amidohydrolase
MFSERLARQVGAIVAPSIIYAAKSQALTGGGQVFPGTTSLDGQTLILMTRDILRELARHGVTRAAILNGHGENTQFLFEAVDLALSGELRDKLKVLVVNWWDLVSADTLSGVFPDGFPGWDLEHAAVIETSLVFALAPELVRVEDLKDETMGFVPSYTVFPQPRGLVPESGLLSQSTPASPEKGLMLVEEVLEALVEIFRREFPGPLEQVEGGSLK